MLWAGIGPLYDFLYRPQSNVIHASPLSLLHHVREGNSAAHFDGGPSLNLVEDALIAALGSYLAIVKLVVAEFEPEQSSEVERIGEAAQRALAQVPGLAQMLSERIRSAREP